MAQTNCRTYKDVADRYAAKAITRARPGELQANSGDASADSVGVGNPCPRCGCQLVRSRNYKIKRFYKDHGASEIYHESCPTGCFRRQQGTK